MTQPEQHESRNVSASLTPDMFSVNEQGQVVINNQELAEVRRCLATESSLRNQPARIGVGVNGGVSVGISVDL